MRKLNVKQALEFKAKNLKQVSCTPLNQLRLVSDSKAGICRLRNIKTNQSYVGYSQDMSKRAVEHRTNLYSGQSSYSELLKEWNENPDNFIFEIVEGACDGWPSGLIDAIGSAFYHRMLQNVKNKKGLPTLKFRFLLGVGQKDRSVFYLLGEAKGLTPEQARKKRAQVKKKKQRLNFPSKHKLIKLCSMRF